MPRVHNCAALLACSVMLLVPERPAHGQGDSLRLSRSEVQQRAALATAADAAATAVGQQHGRGRRASTQAAGRNRATGGGAGALRAVASGVRGQLFVVNGVRVGRECLDWACENFGEDAPINDWQVMTDEAAQRAEALAWTGHEEWDPGETYQAILARIEAVAKEEAVKG